METTIMETKTENDLETGVMHGLCGFIWGQ